jgi:hypothetical protein
LVSAWLNGTRVSMRCCARFPSWESWVRVPSPALTDEPPAQVGIPATHSAARPPGAPARGAPYDRSASSAMTETRSLQCPRASRLEGCGIAYADGFTRDERVCWEHRRNRRAGRGARTVRRTRRRLPDFVRATGSGNPHNLPATCRRGSALVQASFEKQNGEPCVSSVARVSTPLSRAGGVRLYRWDDFGRLCSPAARVWHDLHSWTAA